MSMFSFVKQSADNTCIKCEKVFKVWSQYHSHVENRVCERIQALKPINTSGRTKNQIVKDWEAKQKPGVIIHG